MKNYLKLFLMLSGVVLSTRVWADLYAVSGVSVAAERESALVAKEQALADGQVEAFNRLLSKMVGAERLTQLPAVTTESVLPFVDGVSIEEEKTTATKYMGKISVQFNKDAVQSFLSSQQVAHLTTLPPSILVIPQYTYNGRSVTLTDENPLYKAFKSKSAFAPFYRALVPEGTSEEIELINQALLSGQLSALAPLLDTYDRDRIMLLRLSREEDDMWMISNGFYPTTSMDNQIVRKKFRMSGTNQTAAASQMGQAVFQEMESRWREDKTSTTTEKQVLYLRVPVQSLAEWHAIEKQMQGWSFFEKVTMRGLYLPQILVEVFYKGDVEDIERKLLRQGWRLNRDLTGNGGTLSREIVYE